MNNNLNLNFLNNVRLVISGGISIIVLTLIGYAVYVQYNDDTPVKPAALQGTFFGTVTQFKDNNISFTGVDIENFIKNIRSMSSTKVIVCGTNDVCPVGDSRRENPFAP